MPQNTFTDMIYKSRKVLLEILEEQGFNINDYKDFNLHEVNSMIQAKQLDMILDNPTTQKKNYIKYHLGKTLRPNNIQDYIEDLFHLEKILSNKDDIIIITKEEPNETILRYLVDIWENENIYVRILALKRLQFNILKHTLVPPHSILKDSTEIETFIKNYNINPKYITKSLPDISRFSPVALVIGIRPGEICKIERDSKTAINSLFYRICT
jgi:DNA-directed RNA polymerase subunit H (RpoH/RPB5)